MTRMSRQKLFRDAKLRCKICGLETTYPGSWALYKMTRHDPTTRKGDVSFMSSHDWEAYGEVEEEAPPPKRPKKTPEERWAEQAQKLFENVPVGARLYVIDNVVYILPREAFIALDEAGTEMSAFGVAKAAKDQLIRVGWVQDSGG